jgi:lipopolysaccharide/colanic/teichoic acid biosynthesis glycosyltransferase
MKVYKKSVKPLCDMVFAAFALIMLSPVIVVICLILCITNTGTPFFFQDRPGKNGQIFKIIKFKTMNDKKDKFGQLLPDTERTTIFGLFLRNTSLDEIPQLINVLKRDMSMIGPRPLLPQYLTLYNDFQKRRHEVKPGITGLAQVKGRNAISWKNKFRYDVWYVDHISLGLDVYILWMTLKKVSKREGTALTGSGIHGVFDGRA